jgi:hypothetical protein
VVRCCSFLSADCVVVPMSFSSASSPSSARPAALVRSFFGDLSCARPARCSSRCVERTALVWQHRAYGLSGELSRRAVFRSYPPLILPPVITAVALTSSLNRSVRHDAG